MSAYAGGPAVERIPSAPLRPRGRRINPWTVVAVLGLLALVFLMLGLAKLPAMDMSNTAVAEGEEFDRWVGQPSIHAAFLEEDGEEERAAQATRETEFLAKHRAVDGAKALEEGLIDIEASHPTPNLFNGGCRVLVRGGDKYVLTVRHPDSYVLILDVPGTVAEKVRQDTLTVFTVANGEPGELSLALSGLRVYQKL